MRPIEIKCLNHNYPQVYEVLIKRFLRSDIITIFEVTGEYWCSPIEHIFKYKRNGKILFYKDPISIELNKFHRLILYGNII